MPPAPRGVTMRGSLRSLSAISDERPADVRRQLSTSLRQLLEQVRGPLVDQRVHGVEPQAVDVESRSHISALSMTKRRTSSEPGPSRLTAAPQALAPPSVK